MSELYIGLMSGTSLDGLDVAIVDFATDRPSILVQDGHAFPESMRGVLLEICHGVHDSLDRVAVLDVRFTRWCAEVVNETLARHRLRAGDIKAIGYHGQTVRHRPNQEAPYTIQIGDPNVMAENTKITTVSDFRRRDLAAGGQGAPLVPAFHELLFRDHEVSRAVVNIGGIANVTLLPAVEEKPVTGFDCGPGNVLLDLWIQEHHGEKYDTEGGWAATGTVNSKLLESFLGDKFFTLAPPKSSGREYFNLAWLRNHAIEHDLPENVQATLCLLTARSIIDAIDRYGPETQEVLVCGGGVHNLVLLDWLHRLQNRYRIRSTNEYGIPPEWVEAMAFAWLARQTLRGETGNLPSVTGARHPVILGGIYQA